MEEKACRWIAVAVLSLVLTALACNLPGLAPPTPTIPGLAEDGAPGEVGQVTSTLSPMATGAAETPAPDVTTAAGCTLNGAFVADVTVPDGTEFAPGTAFAKTWRLRNTGTCDWEAGTLLVLASGDGLGGPASVAVPVVAAGATADVSVNLVAPNQPGAYKGNWQLQAPNGTRFGSIVFVQIVVPAPATSTPTRTATPTITPTAGACVAVDPALKPILDHAVASGLNMGCPTAPSFLVQKEGDTGALQVFWSNIDDADPANDLRSLMIWRADTRDIYVIVGEDDAASEGVILAYTDFWTASQPEIHPNCAGMTPPGGYRLPARGFGKVWCENALWGQIGWPRNPEEVAAILAQPLQTGLLMKVSAPSRTYLVALDYRAVWALTIRLGP